MSTAPDPSPIDQRTRWSRVRALVEGALECPPAERRAFLAEREADPALVGEALELLEQEDSQALEPPALPGFGGLLQRPGEAQEQEEGAPERLGPYRLLRRIGAGGMGTVHLALRDDGQFKKRVAIKLVKRGMDTEDVLRRFGQERQVLASLDHPGIARLLDGGMTDDGRPYLVMEHVEGVPIDEWCDRQGANVRERIELFALVCDAVDDAHRSLVVHRDLKPSNVLVTAEGRPKLLDFGIAKLLGEHSAISTLELTATPLKLMTPAYASPEQVRGEPITTASDVYSLGVMLYQILTGRQPLRFGSSAPLEIERVVCRVEPERPSSAIGSSPRSGTPADPPTGDATRELATRRASNPRALRRALAGDLDTVVLKALRKEPRRRYASAAELAADLRRHLAGLPVLARPDTLHYRASRFVRRNRVAVGAAVLVFVSLVAGLAASMEQYRRAEGAREALASQLEIDQERARQLEHLATDLEGQRQRADQARGEAEARFGEIQALNVQLEEQRSLALARLGDVRTFATTLVFAIHSKLAPLEDAVEARALVVSLGLQFLERLASEARDDQGLLRELVAAYLRMADVQLMERDGPEDGVAQALASIARAVDLCEQLMAEAPPDGTNGFTLGSTFLRQGETLALLGRFEEAQGAFERAIEVVAPGLESDERRPGLYMISASALRQRGALHLSAGALEAAQECFERAQVAAELLVRAMPRMRSEQASLDVERSRLASARGDSTAAAELLEGAIGLLRSLLEEQPSHGAWRHDLRLARIELARVLPRVGRTAEARRHAEAVLSELELYDANAHGRPVLLRQRLAALQQLVRLEERGGDRAAALERARQMVETARDVRAQEPHHPDVRRDLGSALLVEAEALLGAGDLDGTDRAVEEATTHFEALAGADADDPRLRQALAIGRVTRARALELRAERCEQEELWRLHLEQALVSWDEALELLEGFVPRDEWGLAEESLTERVLGGRGRCASALGSPRSDARPQ